MRDKKKIEDMLGAVQAIESYKLSKIEEFKADQKTQDAVMFNLVVLGEAANHVSDETQEKFPEVPWSSMIGTRNVIVHGYDQVRLQIVWEIIQRDLGELKAKLENVLLKI